MNINLASSLRPLIGTWLWLRIEPSIDLNLFSSWTRLGKSSDTTLFPHLLFQQTRNQISCASADATSSPTPYTGSAKCAVGESDARFGFIHGDLHAKKAAPQRICIHSRTHTRWKCTQPFYNEWPLHQTPPDAASPRTHMHSYDYYYHHQVTSDDPLAMCVCARASVLLYTPFIHSAARQRLLLLLPSWCAPPASQRVCVCLVGGGGDVDG